MGGCCCCSARRAASNGPPLYFYCPVDLEENEPLASARSLSTAVPVIVVNPGLDTSIPDSWQEPSILLHGDFTFTQPNNGIAENYSNKNDHNQFNSTVSGRDEDRDRFDGSDSCDGSKALEFKNFSDFESDSPNTKAKLSRLEKSTLFVTDEEDVCPTCLEEYDTENPQIITKCQHHFHLSCILEWFERSNTCAICNKIMEIDNMALFDQTL